MIMMMIIIIIVVIDAMQGFYISFEMVANGNPEREREIGRDYELWNCDEKFRVRQPQEMLLDDNGVRWNVGKTFSLSFWSFIFLTFFLCDIVSSSTAPSIVGQSCFSFSCIWLPLCQETTEWNHRVRNNFLLKHLQILCTNIIFKSGSYGR